MPLKICINEISFKKEKLALSGEDLIVVTGPNNAGKSQFLKDIYSHLKGQSPSKIHIEAIDVNRMYTGQEFEDEIITRFPNALKEDVFSMFGASFPRSVLKIATDQSLSFFTDLFCYFATTALRLSEVAAAPMFDRTRNNPELPIQRMYIDDKLEKRISDRFKRAFGVGLIVHRTAGSNIPLYIGDAPDWSKDNDRLSTDYAEKIEALPRLEDQGDGMRAFAGLLLRIMAFDRSIIMIDEPEAFLHPPQARLMGQIIAEERRAGKQIFVATHSADLVQGIIEARPPKLRISRISRDGTNSFFFWLDAAAVDDFLKNTLLRTSNILGGIFHNRVLLCEGDRDAVFYKEMLSVVSENEAEKDVLFINTNGKDRIPDFVRALGYLGVGCKIIADIDLIRSEATLEKLLNLKKCSITSDLLKDARAIVDEVNQKNAPMSARVLKDRISECFADMSNDNKPLPKERVKRISDLLSDLSPFSGVKKAGYRALPSGDCQKRYFGVESALQACEIYLVPEGEIEGFIRTGKRKGPLWIDDALTRDLKGDEELAEARKFVRKVFDLQSSNAGS